MNIAAVMSDQVFQNYGLYYDLIYRDKDYAREVEYVVNRLQIADRHAHALLEFGSGTGRHGSLLAQHGYDVLGVERSESMLGILNKVTRSADTNGGYFRCLQDDIRTVQLSRVFDAVLALFHVVSYQVLNTDVLATFENAARHLRQDGLFLFDVWHGPAVLTDRPSTRVKRVEDETVRLTRIAEPELDTNSNVVIVHYTMLAESKADGRLTMFQEDHRMRYFFPSEINLLADRAGFVMEHTEEFLTGHKPSETTWGVAYVLRKRN